MKLMLVNAQSDKLDQRQVDAKATAFLSRFRNSVGAIPRNPSAELGYVESDVFFELIDGYLNENKPRGTVAYLEVLAPGEVVHNSLKPDGSSVETRRSLLEIYINRLIGDIGVFCWFSDRFVIYLYQSPTLNVRRLLQQLNRGIARRDWEVSGESTHLTPILGYVDVRFATSARELWQLAELALERGRSSLEIEPVQFKRNFRQHLPSSNGINIANVWRKSPQWFVLFTQFVISMIIGLGGPFIIYAVCDALGADISGPIYLGVVIVLVITATTIWIEGFLALRPTTPPEQINSEYPLASIIIPAYLPNEAATIIETLHSFLALEYTNTVQIIVAYNSPTPHMPIEDEMQSLAAKCALEGRFIIEPTRVVGSSSKAQNVNAVVGQVRGRFVGIFDADHHPHPDSLQRAWRWLSNGWDIVQGRCAIRNGTHSWVARMIAIEFEQIYAVSHPGRARFHGFGIFGGSNGYWRTPVLHETRMRHSMLTEDIDSSIRAIVAGYKIAGDRDLISEELAPTDLKTLLNQRLRWAQGWFQVSFRRIMPALTSPNVTIRQKLGLLHLLVWRELFPWYSIQVVPIMAYWVWVYGWNYIHWTIPIFLITTVYTLSTGPGQVAIAYHLAHAPMKKRWTWFLEYFFVSAIFFSPFKDTLSRIAHVKEAMRERAWKVTPRVTGAAQKRPRYPGRVIAAAVIGLSMITFPSERGVAQTVQTPAQSRSPRQLMAILLGGEASTISAARRAAGMGDNATAARLFAQAISAVPSRRTELLREYADALTYSNRSAESVPLYREVLQQHQTGLDRWEIGSHLGLALAWSGQNRAALIVYDQLQNERPGDTDVALHRVRVLASLGQTEAAVAALYKIPQTKWAKGPPAALAAETLLVAARASAQAGDKTKAKNLYAALVRLNRDVGQRVLGEYAALSVREPTTPPPPTNKDKSQTALASETNALLHQAYSQSGSHENAKALLTFQQVYGTDPKNLSARTGIGDENVNLGRIAAKEDHNADAERFFASAFNTDLIHRQEIMREYADQLRYNQKPSAAIPLYIEYLSIKGISDADRKLALVGLAVAYEMIGDSKAGSATYSELLDKYPGDGAVRLAAMVYNARMAARANTNEESAKLFASAIAMNPERSSEIRREYADQLLYSGQSALAIPEYLKSLAYIKITDPNYLLAERNLAQAYIWTSRLNDAKPLYQKLVNNYPDNKQYLWDLLVVEARQAAQSNRNSDSANLFAKAIQLNPEISKEILREYGDQLSFTGRPATSVAFYRLALTQPKLKNDEKIRIQEGMAQAFDFSGRYTDAKAEYRQILGAQPLDTTLQWHYLVVSARELAAKDKNKEASVLLAQAITLRPDRRELILKEYADKLTYSDRPKLAIPLYEELISNDDHSTVAQPKSPSLASGGNRSRDARLALAVALSWNGQKQAALQQYELLFKLNENDIEANIGIARMLSWLGRQTEAINVYNKMLVRNPGSSAVVRGIAQAEDWKGHHQEAQATLHQLIDHNPDDVEARRLLAESLVSSGRPDRAIDEVQKALKMEHKDVQQRPEQKQITAGATL